MVSVDQVLSAEELAKTFKEGRDAFRVALSELKHEGLIWVRRTKIEGRWVSQSGFSAAENQTLEIRHLCELLSQYSQYIHIANTAKSLTNSSEKNSDEKYPTKISIAMGAWREPVKPEDQDYFEEQERERVKAMARAQEEYNEQKQEYHESKLAIRDRDRANPEKWSHSDSAYEFANQLHSRWDVAPWKAGKSRFIPALASARKKHGTNGALEKRMTEIFLASPVVQTMKDPEQIWKFYIASFGSLLEQARYSMPDSAKLQSLADEAAADMAELMEGLTDV